tara:strand:- start:9263 stop:9511 length:249 start_codon:yes stop_codon:yes gene_type:complete
MQKIKIPHFLRLVLFAIMMSFLTSSTVSGVTVLFTVSEKSEFLFIWIQATLKSWPLVFVLILVFVPVLNRLLNIFFITPKNK